MRLPTPYPYLIAALDQYYGISPSYEEERPTERTPSAENAIRTARSPGKKMRILLATFWNYPGIGGLTRYLATLKRGLEKRGHHVDIIAPNHFSKYELYKLRKDIRLASKKFYLGRFGNVNPNILSNNQTMYSYEAMLGKIDLGKYDIFHAQDRFTANILGRLNQAYHKPLFFTPHGFMTHKRLKFNLIEKGSVEEAYFYQIDRKAVEVADQVIMLCEVFRPILSSLGVDDSKLTTIHTGIRMRTVEKRKKSSRDNVVITCISRLRPRKGHTYLFEALARIRNQLANVTVFIVGDGGIREELEEEVDRLDLSNVHFLGHRKDVPEILSQSDIYVLPTTSDVLPISIIEAMFAGQAIITTNCGGIPEIIQHLHTGIMTEPGNAEQLADALRLLLQDPALRERLARNAKQYAKTHLTTEKMVNKMEEVYRSFLVQK